MSTPTSRFLLKLVVVLVVLVLAGVWTLRSLRPVAIVEPVISMTAIDAKPGTVTVEEEFAMDLKSEKGGRVLNQDFALSPGAKVKDGQVLVRLDPRDIELQLKQDQAIYDTTKQHFDTDQSAELKLESDEATYANHQRENAQGAFATADLEAEQRSLEAEKQAIKVAKIDQTQKLAELQYTVDTEKLQLERMTILCPPYDMIVKTVLVHPGDLIGAEAPIATLITQGKHVLGKISDEDFAKIKVGQKASVFFVPYDNFLFNGTVSKILPTTDPLTQRHIIYLDVDIPDEKLIPGINGEVSVVVDQHEAKAVVPRRAVFSVNGDNVFVVKGGRVELRKVTKGFVWARGIEITQGLEPGEQVIVDGLEDFHPGEAVSVDVHPSDVIDAKK